MREVPSQNRYDYVVSRTKIKELTSNFTYLMDSACKVEGYLIYGSPWQPEYYDWAFNLQEWVATQASLGCHPNATDILITHGPALGSLTTLDERTEQDVTCLLPGLKNYLT